MRRILWFLQRGTAILVAAGLVWHLFRQHASPEAFSTGLTVWWAFQNPWMQAAYIVMLLAAVLHLSIGLGTVIYDYIAPGGLRRICLAFLMIAAIGLSAWGLWNVLRPGMKLETVLTHYAHNGLPLGTSSGSPPGMLPKKGYDLARDEQTELRVLRCLAERFLVAQRDNQWQEIFSSGSRFDAWCLAQLVGEPSGCGGRTIFASHADFARWAIQVRIQDARRRLKDANPHRIQAAKETLTRLGSNHVR
jgi:succinate dehydrogenase hydrophobic membrane anchor protein